MNLLWTDKEKHIVNLFRKGDPLAMNKLYMEYADYLTGVCARYISDEETLKDVLQESFIKIYTQIQRFEYRGKGSLKAWITRIAINEALGELQKDKHLFVLFFFGKNRKDGFFGSWNEDVLFGMYDGLSFPKMADSQQDEKNGCCGCYTEEDVLVLPGHRSR